LLIIINPWHCVAAAASDGPLFGGAQFGTGSRPISVAIADLNSDGAPDLAVANSYSDDVSVLLGNGAGSFQAEQRFGTGWKPSSIAIADLNGDGAPDLAVATSENSEVSVLLGNGDGTFQAEQRFGAGTWPSSIAIVDLNGDGAPDLAVANGRSDDVSVLLGNGDGSFQTQQRFGTGRYPGSIAIADLNGDGAPDLGVVNLDSNDVSVLLGNGSGSFQAEQRVGAGQHPTSIAITDLNGDGAPDLAVTNGASDDVSVLMGNGAGGFQAEQRFGAGDGPSSVAIADLNGDGAADLAVANRSSDDVSVLLGNGAGSFLAEQHFDAGSDPYSIAIADLNDDGAPDLAVANLDSSDVSVLLGNGAGSFLAEQHFGAGDGPTSVAITDLNGDGAPDLAVTNGASDDVSVLMGNGAGGFQAEQRFGAGDGPWSVAIADLNGDGAADLAVANYASDDVSVLMGNGAGGFQAEQRFGAGRWPESIAIADLNGDGAPDLAVATSYNSEVSVLLGNGDGSFQAEQRFGAGWAPNSIAIADLNGDGAPDLAVTNQVSNDVSVLLGDGAGGFQAEQRFGAGRWPESIAIADLNGDGAPDLAVATSYNSEVSVLLGNGDGSFQAEQRFGAGSWPHSIAIADLNGDGAPDLAVANRSSDDVSVLLGNGDGSFQAEQRFGTGSQPWSIAIADLNGDDALDLAIANADSNDVSVLTNRVQPGAPLIRISQSQLTNAGLATVRLSGVGFEPSADDDRVELRGASSILVPNMITQVSAQTLDVLFDLTGAEPGDYQVVLIRADGDEFTAARRLQIIEAGPAPTLSARLAVPEAVRPGRRYSLQVHYTNIAGTDLPPPLLEVRSNVPLALTSEVAGATRVQLLAPGNPPDRMVLGAGMSGTITLYFTAPADFDAAFELVVLTDESAAVDWETKKASMRPPAIDAAQWDQIWPDLLTELGATWGDYRDLLARNFERYLARGALQIDAGRLLDLTVDAIRNLPTAAISGVLTDADTGGKLSGVTLTARSSDGAILRQIETGGESLGWFSFADLPTGDYSIHAVGYFFDPAVSVTIAGDADRNGLTLAAHPFPPDEPGVEVGTPQSAPVVAGDGAGSLFLLWQEGAYLAWAMRDPAENWFSGWVGDGIAGSAPALWYTPDLNGEPALAALWVQDAEDSSILAMAVARIAPDGLVWGAPQDLTADAYADMTPVVTLDGEQALVLWLQRDLAFEDDTDLYWLTQPTAEAVLSVSDGVVDLVGGETWSSLIGLDGLSECVGVDHGFRTHVADRVPVIGGPWGLTLEGEACRSFNPQCEGASISGFATAVAESGFGDFEADVSVDLSGDYGIDPKSCRYVADEIKLSLPLFDQTLDLLTPGIPIVISGVPLGNIKIGGTASLSASGSMTWGAGFPGRPQSVALGLGASAGPKITFESLGKVLEAEASGTFGGQFDFKLPPSRWDKDWCATLGATVKTNLLLFCLQSTWEKRWGCNPAGASVLLFAPEEMIEIGPGRLFVQRSFVSIVDGLAVDIEESLSYEKNDFVGTGNIYEGIPVLGDISDDLYPDGPPALAQGPNGEIRVVWVKQHRPRELGAEVWTAWYDGAGEWLSAPLTKTLDFHRSPTLAFDSAGTPIALWARASNAGLDFDLNSVEELLEAAQRSDIWFSQYDDQAGEWAPPAVVASLAGSDESPTLTAGTDGTLVAAWIHTPDDVGASGARSLLAAIWNGAAWSAPIEVAAGVLLDEPRAMNLDGRPALVWSQDSDGEVETFDDRQLKLSFWDGAAWSVPEHPSIAPATQPGAEAVRARTTSAASRWESWVLGDPPAECCEQSGEEKPVPPEPDLPDDPGDPGKAPPWNHEDDATSGNVRSYDPNEKLGPSGFGVNQGVEAGSRLDYLVYFENLATAAVPAQEVFITDCLDALYDWDSFRFDALAFGDLVRANDGEEALYATRLVIPDYRADVAKSWWVDFTAEFDLETGCLTATFRTLDPETGELPADVFAGLLPPEDGSGRGQGHIAFSVAIRPNLADGIQVSNLASIVFDTNDPIVTNTWSNPIGIRPETFDLHLGIVGNGRVASDDETLDCDADCTLAYEGDARVVLEAIPQAATRFDGWAGACFGQGSCTLSMDEEKAATARFVPIVDATVADIDGNGIADARTDGLLTVRFLFGFRGTTLIDGAVGTDCTRCDAEAIAAYIESTGTKLDIDGNGTTDALTDGLLLTRCLFGFVGPTLTGGAVGTDCTRCSAAEIEPYCSALRP
jgi:hypothetical protein